MTREEAKNIAVAISFEHNCKQRITVDVVHELIDQIYDECEAREMLLTTKDVYCVDCKHYLDKIERKDDEN